MAHFLVCMILMQFLAITDLVSSAQAAGLDVVMVRSSGSAGSVSADGVVEAVRQTVIAAQVSGAIVELPVKAGDSIKAGQMLLRLDGRAASQQARASQAQAEAARAALQVATKDFERQKQLFARQYISQAQLDRAESLFRSATADANAQLAQAAATLTQSGFYTLTAPYAGRVAEVSVSQGDMVTPGRSLMTVFDPAVLRVTATLPQAQVAALSNATVNVEIPGLPSAQRQIRVDKFIVLPVSDAHTHTVQVRIDIPASGHITGLVPGMFARVQLPLQTGSSGENARLFVPVSAVLKRAELHAVYVVNVHGKVMLRQVRPGGRTGSELEILAGLSAGEKVVANPLTAALPLRD